MFKVETKATVIAHRGASAYAPENTFAAYDLALAMGADKIELDLRMTADGELVTAHDPTLWRTAGDSRLVSQLRRGDLVELAPELRPLTLDAVLGRYGQRTRYCVDLKPSQSQAERRLVRAIRRHRLRSNVVVQSFCEQSLRRVNELDRTLPLVQLLTDELSYEESARRLHRVADFASGIGPAAATVDTRLIGLAHSLSLTVQPYTVNEEAEMLHLLELGVDGIFTDAPDRLRRIVTAANPATSTRTPKSCQHRRRHFRRQADVVLAHVEMSYHPHAVRSERIHHHSVLGQRLTKAERVRN